ncbi:hypothetical protein TSUD_308600 [Trifolium subterraneum]|nr:hypothetical protein TSUD_308600 [Trifolium subterraneum]
MAHHQPFFLFGLIVMIFITNMSHVISTNQSEFFSVMKESLSGNFPLDWSASKEDKPICEFTGITCDDKGNVISLDFTGWSSLSGNFPSNFCSCLPNLRVINIGYTKFKFPINSIINCSHLEQLNMNHMHQSGTLPDFSSLKSLRVLDLSYNSFTGDFPVSVFNLTTLEVLNFNENSNFNLWQLPKNFERLKNLKSMVLSTCILHGQIPPSISNITTLLDLELSGNFLTGQIPKELGLLKNLQLLELYYNFNLVGNIPEELGNLTDLVDLDMSVNKFTGTIPSSVFKLPKLQVLQLYNNSLSGEISDAIENSTTLRILSLYDNFLTGHVPPKLGQFSGMTVLDLSENRLSGPLPEHVCKGGKLLYFLVLDNFFSGVIPDSYENCMFLLRFRVSNNRLEGSVPKGLLSLPHVSIIDLSSNNLTGPIPEINGNSRNLSELFLQRNKISGEITPTISRAINLVKIDFSYNFLYGPIPSEIGNLRKLNLLMLQANKLNSTIPGSLSSLESLNLLDLSNNLLTGNIPESLSVLLPNSINFSHNLLSGPIPPKLVKGGLVESFAGNPGLCVMVPVYANSSDQKNFPSCSHGYKSKKMNTIWVAGAALFLKKRCSKDAAAVEHEDTLSSSFFSYDVRSFHMISFDQREIVESLVEKNIMGHGGSGTVYKIELKSGDIVAVKRLWSRSSKDSSPEDALFVDKALKAELSCSFKDDMVKVLRIAIRCSYKAPASRPTMKEVVQLLIEAEPKNSDSCKLSTKDASTNATLVKKSFEL